MASYASGDKNKGLPFGRLINKPKEMKEQTYALSLKQPWAALLVHGHKSIDVRRWPTARRGRVLIHAAKVSDLRPEAWRHVPESLRAAAEICGGIIGSGEIVECRTYTTLRQFVADGDAHLNDPAWFAKPALYGFVFTNLKTLPFQACPGWMRFFPVAATIPMSRASANK